MTPTRRTVNAAHLMALAWACLCLPAQAELKPKWELGLGLAAIDFPMYRGAQDRSSYLLPAPYVQYRGDILQVDRDRVRSLLFRLERLELDFSLNGSVPVKSSDSEARRGMPDLDPTAEIGPSLNVHLLFDKRKQTNLDLRLPLRAVVATSLSHLDRQGWLFHPQLSLDLNNVAHSPWNLGFVAGVLYGDRGYHAYYYDVAPQYATPTRPAYGAEGGYSGKQFTATLSRRSGDLWFGGFVRWDDVSGAVFADSPLVRSRQSFAAGVMVAWIFAKSDQLVEVSGD